VNTVSDEVLLHSNRATNG